MTTTNQTDVMSRLAAEIARQDQLHAGWGTTRDGVRAGIAAIEDEAREAREAWRSERRVNGWSDTESEVIQVAAVAFRLAREISQAEEGR